MIIRLQMPYISSGLFFFSPAPWKKKCFKKLPEFCKEKNRCFSKREKLSTCDSSCCKNVHESGTTSLQSSLTFTAGRWLNGDRSFVFRLVGHFCSAPKYMTAGKPAKFKCFLPDLIDLTINLFLLGALFLILNHWEGSWLGTKASVLAHSQKKKTFHSPH